jgi:hypothetical protein
MPRQRLSRAATFIFGVSIASGATLIGCAKIEGSTPELEHGGSGGGEPEVTGGSASVGGSPSVGGSAGGGVCDAKPGSKMGDGLDTTIDAFDDKDLFFDTAGVGVGAWDYGKDPLGMGILSPLNPKDLVVAGGKSGNGLHIAATGLTGWGASLSAFLDGVTGSFDASKYGGVAFYLKGTTNVMEGEGKLMILARMPDVMPGPGSCCSDVLKGFECYSAHRVVIDVPADWQEVRITWADFKSPAWGVGSVTAFNPNRIRDINFAFNHDLSSKDASLTSFDVWIDSVRFLEKGETSNVGVD